MEPERVAIAAVERGPRGTRIVAIDERGDRRFELVQPASGDATTLDASPAISPDGRWLAFSSTRERTGGETSLWIAPLGPDALPVRITNAPGGVIDTHPTWAPDGRAIVFASTRDGGDFDLYRLAIANGRAAGEPVALTSGAHHEVTPSVALDGAIVYAVARPLDDRSLRSHLEERTPSGQVRALTEGPADTAPAISPDGRLVAFARDGDLWAVARDRSPPPPIAIVRLPLTEETAPAWSRDGRFLFATSIFRGEEQRPLFSSVIHVDLKEATPRIRMLADRAGPIVRLSPAIAQRALDVAALHRDPEYVPELARIMTEAITKLQTQQGTP